MMPIMILKNVIIKEIWSIKLEFPNFFWGVYKQATRGPVTHPFQWTRQWGWSALSKGTAATASRFEPGTSQLRVHGLKSTEPQQLLKVCENLPNLSMDTQEMKYYFWWGKKKKSNDFNSPPEQLSWNGDGVEETESDIDTRWESCQKKFYIWYFSQDIPGEWVGMWELKILIWFQTFLLFLNHIFRLLMHLKSTSFQAFQII